MVTYPCVAAEVWALNGRIVPGSCRMLVEDPYGELPPVVHPERPALFVVPSWLFDIPRVHYNLEEREDIFEEVSQQYHPRTPTIGGYRDLL